MAYPFLSAEWLKGLAEVLNNDRRYAEVAKNWEADMLVLVEPDPCSPADKKAAGAQLDLWYGKCCRASFHLAGDPEMPKPAFTPRAQRRMLLRGIEGKLDSMRAMVTRKLKVEGNLANMTRSVPTVLDLVRCCRAVESAH
jgi:putative sterol carrier protein